MEKKYTLTLDKEFLLYCELNEINDVNKLAMETFNRGFSLLKFGETPSGTTKIKEKIIEKEIIKEVPIEIIIEKEVKVPYEVEKIKEVIKEVPVEIVKEVIKDMSPLEKVYDPTHPDADKDGYLSLPNVNVATEMVDLISAQRAYEADIAVLSSGNRMHQRVFL